MKKVILLLAMLVILSTISIKAMATPYCLDNNTLVDNQTIIINGSSTTIQLPIACLSGCSNNTLFGPASCNPSQSEQPFLFGLYLTVAGLMFLVIALIGKKLSN